MRPALLNPLFAPATSLPGIGRGFARLIERLAGPLVLDLLWHLPSSLVDRRAAAAIADLEEGRIETIRLTIEAHKPAAGRRPYRIICGDKTGRLLLVYFTVKGNYLERLLPVGAERIVSGRVEFYEGLPQIVHPDLVLRPEEASRLQAIEPVYPLTAGLRPRPLQKAIAAAVERAPELPEWIDPALKEARGWPSWKEALRSVHAPRCESDLEPSAPARERLAYDEIFANQLAVALFRARRRRRPGRAIVGTGALSARVEEGLGFTLTAAQSQAITEIAADMASPHRMMRLVQGDVGSGKTVVALMAMLKAVEAGAQAVLMAPTAILARQHHATLSRHLDGAVEIGLLTGREKGKVREALLARLQSAALPILVGTHALIEPDVVFADLALCVIDEQHRFGVGQRLALAAKGENADTLVMSATPIPRSLMMTVLGDLDCSRLWEKPAGRLPVLTRALPLERQSEVVAAIARPLEEGGKAYWICPVVEESESADVAAAEERFRSLAPLFPGRVGLVHGRMKAAQKDRAMAAFAEGATRLLVATTVIEVGVDVPEASIMVIEHAERFGLCQLHQLRGRIGRGRDKSTCLLMYEAPLGAMAKRRIEILRESEDGFLIAEEDLRLRGAGEILGTRQSGLPQLKLADLLRHEGLFAIAHDDARLVLERDGALESPRGAALRLLLTLFRRDEAIRYLRAG